MKFTEDDPHQRAVFQKAQELLQDGDILAQALSKEGMKYLNEEATGRYVQELAVLVLADDSDAFGRRLLDQVIHYVWAVAEEEVSRKSSAHTH